MKNLNVIYTITFFIEPPKKGLLVIEPSVLTPLQYSLVEKDIFTTTHDGSISVGETQKDGVVFRVFTENYNQTGELIDAIFALALDLVNYGLDNPESKHNNETRYDLRPCLENAKCYILSNKLDKPKGLSNYFSPHEIFYPNKLKGTLKSISKTNKEYFKENEDDYKFFK